MAEMTKEVISKFFEKCYNKMTTDTGRNIALGIYYIFKTVIIGFGFYYGFNSVGFFIP
jgi:hypothetical protein